MASCPTCVSSSLSLLPLTVPIHQFWLNRIIWNFIPGNKEETAIEELWPPRLHHHRWRVCYSPSIQHKAACTMFPQFGASWNKRTFSPVGCHWRRWPRSCTPVPNPESKQWNHRWLLNNWYDLLLLWVETVLEDNIFKFQICDEHFSPLLATQGPRGQGICAIFQPSILPNNSKQRLNRKHRNFGISSSTRTISPSKSHLSGVFIWSRHEFPFFFACSSPFVIPLKGYQVTYINPIPLKYPWMRLSSLKTQIFP